MQPRKRGDTKNDQRRDRRHARGLGERHRTRDDDQRGTRGTRRNGSTTKGNHEDAKTRKRRSNAETASARRRGLGDDTDHGKTINAEPAAHAEAVQRSYISAAMQRRTSAMKALQARSRLVVALTASTVHPRRPVDSALGFELRWNVQVHVIGLASGFAEAASDLDHFADYLSEHTPYAQGLSAPFTSPLRARHFGEFIRITGILG